MKSEIIFESGDHKWVYLGRDPQKKTTGYRYQRIHHN